MTKNISASVRARLTSKAKETKRPFQEVLQHYGLERFLYRLATAPHDGRFVLKGALLLRAWGGGSQGLTVPARAVFVRAQMRARGLRADLGASTNTPNAHPHAHDRNGMGGCVRRPREGPFEGPAVAEPPALPGDCYSRKLWGDG
jgi:hypothetical protein